MELTLSELEQQNLPAIPPPPTAEGRRLLTELELQTYRNKLIESDGDMAKAAISLDEMRDVLYTCRMKANPMMEQEGAEKAAKKKKEPKEPSTNKVKLSGDDVNSFLG